MSIPATSRTRQRVFRSGNAFLPWLVPAMLLLVATGFALAFALAQLGKPRLEAWLIPCLALALTIMVAFGNRNTLTSDARGLSFRSNLPGVLARWQPDWTLAWREIEAVSWVPGVQPTLSLAWRGGARKLNAFGWQLEAQEWKRCQRALRMLRGRSRSEFDTSILPLVRELREHGVEVPATLATGRAAGFDLAKNATTRVVLAIAGAAAAFWFADAMVSDQMYVAEPWIAIGAVAALAMLLIATGQARADVPAGVNAGLTLVAGVALALATYGGLQRLNQLAGRDDPVAAYTLLPDGTLEPEAPGATPLRPGFFGDAAYWRAQKPGSRHRFVRHDALGFETLDIAEYRARLKAFYGRDPGRDMNRT